ncbi:MAG: Trk system potassium transport protein TrkA [Acidimicrobiales bacterium]|nr:MAG: Trk system potassium transport protein TrkA [Acidimicrobiales bacterium]
MRVVVVGAGEVGSYVAERLANEGHEVSVVEHDEATADAVSRRIDAHVVIGNGALPSVMEAAGCTKADLVVAVTNSDESNLLSAFVAKRLGAKRTVVRIESAELRGRDAEDLRSALGVDEAVDPDEEVARDIGELIEHPGAREVEVLAGGEVVVLGAVLKENSPLVGRSLKEIADEYEPEWEFLFGAITRGRDTVIPRGDYELRAGDMVRVLCRRQARREISRLLGLRAGQMQRVVLLGGGRTAELVAERLSPKGVSDRLLRRREIAIVERDPQRAAYLEHRVEAEVFCGDIADTDVLDQAEISRANIVVALTGEDEANVLACLYAKDAGADETAAVVHRLTLARLLEKAGVDAVLSPRIATANGVLRIVRGEGVAAVATFLEGEAEVLEFAVEPGSPADGKLVSELDLPREVLIGAIVRDGKARIARGRSELRARDHVVVVARPGTAGEVGRLFG